MVDESKLSPEKVANIQNSLLNRVLPMLEKHLTEAGDKFAVRGFVVVCYAQTIRKLPMQKFHSRL